MLISLTFVYNLMIVRIKNIYNCIALVMAFLLFISSMGLSIDLHYCKGEFKNFSLIGKADTCHTAERTCPHHKAQIKTSEERSCCTNELVEIENLDFDFATAESVKSASISQYFVIAYVKIFLDSKVESSTINHEPAFEENDQTQDIYAMLDRYLI